MPNLVSFKQEELIELSEELEEVQLASKTGGYRIHLGNASYFVSKGYLAIHEIQHQYDAPTDFFRVIHPDDRAWVEAAANDLIQDMSDGKAFAQREMIYRIVVGEPKKTKIIKDIVKPRIENGRVVGSKGVIQDITDDHLRTAKFAQIANSLEVTKKDLEESQYMANLGSWEYDLINDKQIWSAGQFRLYETDPGNEPRNFQEFISHIHPDDVRAFMAELPILSDVNNAMESSEQTFRIIGRKTGKVKTIRSRIKRIVSEGKVIGFKGVNQDITEQQAMLDSLSTLSTDLQNANAVLSQMRDDLKKTQQVAGVGSWSIDFRTNNMAWSDELKLLLEFPVDYRPTVEEFFRLTHPQDLERNRRAHEELIATIVAKPDIVVQGETRVLTPQSKTLKVLSFSTRAVVEGNIVVGIKGVIKDISKEKRDQEELKRLNDNLIETQRLSGTASWYHDLKTGSVRVSEGWWDVFDLRSDQLSLNYQAIEKFVHPEDAEIPIRSFSRFSDGAMSADETVFRIISAKGITKYVKVVSRAVRVEDDLVAISGSIMDITVFKQYEDQLIKSQTQLRLLFETMNQGVVFHNSELKITEYNPAAKHIFGYSSPRKRLFEEDGRELFEKDYPFNQAIQKGHAILGRVLKVESQVERARWIRMDSFPITIDRDRSCFSIFEDITDAKTSYELLKKSEERFSNIFKHSGVGMAVMSLTGDFVDVNEALVRITGYPADQLIKLSSRDLTYRNDYEEELHHFSLFNSRKLEVFQIEKRFVRKDRSICWVVMTASLVSDQHTFSNYVIAQFQDITSRVLSEKKVFEYQQRFISAFYGSSVSMVIADLNYHIVEANDAACNFFGYEKSEIQKLSIRGISHPDDVKLNDSHVEKLLSGEIKGFTTEKRYIHKTGRTIYGLLTVNLIRNAEGTAINLIAQIQDISETVEIREAIKKERQKFEHIFKYSGMGMGLANSEGRLVEVNEAFSKMLGYGKDEMLSHTIVDLTHPDDIDRCLLLMGEVLNESRQRFSIEKRYRHKNGDYISVHVTASKVIDPNGQQFILGQIQDINELRREQIIRQESEERYRYLVENAHLGIGFSKGSNVVYANPALLKMFEYETIDEYSKKTLPEMATQETKALIEKRLRLVDEGKKVEEVYTGRFVTRSGRVKTLEVQARSISIGKESYRMAIITDLTDKLELEKKLMETQHVFDQAQKFTKVGSWRWIIGTDEIYWSDSVFALLGLRKDKFTVGYKNFIGAIHPDDRDNFLSSIDRCIHEHIPFDVEHRILTKRGKVRWLQGKGNVIRNSSGKAVEMYGVLRDVTQSKQIAEELQRSKEQYQLLAESGQELICLHTTSGHFIYASPSLKLLLGYNPKKIPPALRSIDLVHPDDREAFHKFSHEVVEKKGQSLTGRFRFLHQTGGYVWCEKNMKAVVDESGNVRSIRSLTRSIEQQIAFENQLKEANRQLEAALIDLREASKEKENFLSVMSHEIRTPLNSVIGLSNLLIRRSPREDQVETVKILKNSADNLMHLVNDILDFNKIQSGNLELEMIRFSLKDLLRQQHSAFKLMAQDKGLEFNFHIDAEIPDSLEGDVTRLNQIVTNLLTNAIKFTHKGHVKLQATLKSKAGDRCKIRFVVQDTGIGIPRDKHEIIFEPFRQSDSHIAREFGGTGLGLSIVKSLVDLMGGSIALVSEPGKGTSFAITVELLAISENSQYPEIAPVLTTNDMKTRPETVKVLYVEDVESNRFLVKNLLSDQNIICHAVSSGKQALVSTAKTKFDVILMDLQMPVLDGYSAAVKIRQQRKGRNKTTPIIAFTAEVYSATLKAKTLQHQIEYVISKPFNPDTLIEKIKFYSGSKNDAAPFFSFAFYQRAFDNDPEKLSEIKKALIRDFRRFDKMLQKMDQKMDLTGIRNEVHKITPIVKNLSFHELSHVLDKFRQEQVYNRKVSHLALDAHNLVNELLKQLKNLELLRT